MQYPQIDNTIFELGPVALRWYGLTYVAAFVTAWWLGNRQAARRPGWDSEAVSDLIFYGALGVIVGGRLGYALFYGLDQLAADPLWLFQIWRGGMSFHGGMLGVIVAMWLFARKTDRRWLAVTDFVAPLVPLGLGFGRLGNFINAELPGRVSEGVGFYYPCGSVQAITDGCYGAYESVLRHPSSLYQATAEGLILFAALFILSMRPRRVGFISGAFLVGYGTLRWLTELFREPDAHLGFVLGEAVSMGQVLSFPMVLIGIGMMLWSRSQEPAEVAPAPTPAAEPVSAPAVPAPGAGSNKRKSRKKRKA